jgi:ubiquitin carboxyl-terminal hydrolase 5/13
MLPTGTITPHGADVWSYASDEDSLVKVPRLGEYLSHWGIDIMRLEKTDQTLAEQEVALNKGYNWSKVLESGADLQMVSAPGCIGLTNIGSSCYMNAVLQTIFSVPEVCSVCQAAMYTTRVMCGSCCRYCCRVDSRFKADTSIVLMRFVAP